MSDDIVERLMICARYDPDQKEAASEIERLRAEHDALRALLREARWANNEASASKRAEIYARIDAALNKGGGDE